MIGKIISFNQENGDGIIRNDAGFTFSFNVQQVMSHGAVKTGVYVDFNANDEDQAMDIYFVEVNYDPIDAIKKGYRELRGVCLTSTNPFIRMLFSGYHNKMSSVGVLISYVLLFLPIVELSNFNAWSVLSGIGAYLITAVCVMLFVGLYGGISKQYIYALFAAFILLVGYKFFDAILMMDKVQTGFQMGAVEKQYTLTETMTIGFYVNCIFPFVPLILVSVTGYVKNPKTY